MNKRREDEYVLADQLMLQKMQRKILRNEKREYEIRSRIFWNNLFPRRSTRVVRSTERSSASTYSPSARTKASPSGYERSVIVKISFKTFKKGEASEEAKTKIRTNTAECIDYLLRFEDKKAFDSKRDDLSKEELKERFRNDAVFKIMISPEDPEILDENYIREVVSVIESHTKHHLKWAAVFHDNTEHPHAHIIISRTSGDGLSWNDPLVLDRAFIAHELRESCQKISTRILGRKNIQEYRIPFVETLRTKGLARIDHVISGSSKKEGSGLFIPSSEDYFILSRARLSELPLWQQTLVDERLRFLSENTDTGFRKEGGFWKCYKPYTWKDELMNLSKTEPFKEIESEYGKKIEVVRSGSVKEAINGKVIAHTIVDDNSEKVGLVVRSDDNRLFYTETNMSFSAAEAVDGKDAEIAPKAAKDKRYRIAEVKILDDQTNGRNR